MRLWILLLVPALLFADVCSYKTDFENMVANATSFLKSLNPSAFTDPCSIFIFKYLEDVFLTYPSWDPNALYTTIATLLDLSYKCDFVTIQENLTTVPFALAGLALSTKLNVDWQEPLQRFLLFINATKQYYGWSWVNPSYLLWLVKYGNTYKDLFSTLYILLVLKSMGINVTEYINKYTPGVRDVVIYSLQYNVGAFTDNQLVSIVPELYVMALKLGFLNLSDVCEITTLILNSRGLDELYTSTKLNFLLASAGVPFWYIIAKKCYEAGFMSGDDYARLVNALDYFTEYHLQNDIDTFVLGDKLRLYMYYAYKCEYNTTWPIDVIFEPVTTTQPVVIYNITNITTITSVTSVTQITNVTSVTTVSLITNITNVTTVITTVITTTLVINNTTIVTTILTTLSKIITYSYQQPLATSPIFLLVPALLGALSAMSKENAKRSMRRGKG